MARIGRIVFLGTGQFAVPILTRLPDLADDVLVITAPPRPAGRGLRERPSPVARAARELRLQTQTPTGLRSAGIAESVRGFRPDGLLLAAYGRIVPDELLRIAPRPPLNVHPSLLPRHRGAAPVTAALLDGDQESGVTVIVMTPELDAGPIVAQWRVTIGEREDAPELEARLASLAAERLPSLLERWAAGALEARPQDSGVATSVQRLSRGDGWIDWTRTAREIDRQVRALQPWPGAWTTIDGRRLHVRRAHPQDGSVGEAGSLLPDPRTVSVATGEGVLVLDEVQPHGRPRMAASAWRNGLRNREVRFGVDAPS